MTFSPLVPGIVLHKHFQHVPDFYGLAKEAGAEMLNLAYLSFIYQVLERLLKLVIGGSIVILLWDWQLNIEFGRFVCIANVGRVLEDRDIFAMMCVLLLVSVNSGLDIADQFEFESTYCFSAS